MGGLLFLTRDRFEQINAARMSAVGEGWTEPNLYFHPIKGMKMRTNLASSSKTPDSTWNREFFFCSAVQPMLDLSFLNSGILQED